MPDAKPDIKAIAFDWGGVFTENTFDSSAVRNFSKLFNVSEAQVGETYFPLMEHFEAGEFSWEEFYRRFGERSGLETDYDTFQKTFLGSVRERSTMYDVLKNIPTSYSVGMLSNNVALLCDGVRDDPRMSRITQFVFSNEIGVRKPDPQAFHALTEALGAAPNETVFIDDNPDNIAACEALGFHGLLIDSYDGFVKRWNALLPELALETTH